MIDYIFNEQKRIEAMINSNDVDNNAPMKTVRLLARYCHFVHGFDKDATYRYIISYMNTYALDFHEQRSMKKVKGCIQKATTNGSWKNIEKVYITQSELDKISSLNDEKQEKIAFVLLADIKYHAMCSGENKFVSFLSISNIFQMARVPCPYKERSYFMNFLFKDRDDGALADRELRKSRSNTTVKYKLNYVSYDAEDPVVLELSENNYKELAFTYLNWKHGGYKECKSCGRLFKSKANAQYCKKCASKSEKMEHKIIQCIDCGINVTVSPKNNRTCRCIECQSSADRNAKKEWWQNNKSLL